MIGRRLGPCGITGEPSESRQLLAGPGADRGAGPGSTAGLGKTSPAGRAVPEGEVGASTLAGPEAERGFLLGIRV